MTWKGVIIEESLDDKELLNLVKIAATKKSFLEEEEEKGVLHFHNIEVNDSIKDEFVNKAEASIKQGWYMHICKKDRMVIIFNRRHFEFSEKEKDKIKSAKDYGIAIGILPEQMKIEPMIRDPFG